MSLSTTREAPPLLLRRFGKKIRELRTARDWTQQQFADKLGVGRTHILHIESGRVNPSLLMLEVVADGLHLSLSDLFKGL